VVGGIVVLGSLALVAVFFAKRMCFSFKSSQYETYESEAELAGQTTLGLVPGRSRGKNIVGLGLGTLEGGAVEDELFSAGLFDPGIDEAPFE
jgi:hypothetical protein